MDSNYATPIWGERRATLPWPRTARYNAASMLFEKGMAMNRPLVWVCIPLIGGTLAAAWGFVPGWLLPSAMAVVGMLLPVVSRGRPAAVGAGLVFVFFGAGALLWNARHQGPPGDALSRLALSNLASTEYTIEGQVGNPDLYLRGTAYMQFELHVDRVTIGETTYPVQGGVIVRWSEPQFPVYAMQRVRVTGQLDTVLGRVNPDTTGVEDARRRHGIHSAVRLRGAGDIETVAPGPAWSLRYLASRLRGEMADRLSRAVPESSLPFVLTVWLGDRRTITSETYRDFLHSGTAHILAVSGVHIGIVFVMMSYMLRVVIKRRRLRTLLTMVAVLLFAVVAGARISTLRAAIMIMLYLLADLFDREPDAPTALSIAAIIFAVHDPNVLFDAGFQLSFLSISSILLFRNPIRSRMDVLPPVLREGLSSTLAVQIVPLPVALNLFHVLPLAAIPANLLVIPLLSIVLWICALTSITALIAPPVAPIFGHALQPFVYLIAQISESVSNMRGSHVFLTSPTTLAIICYWIAITAIVLAVRATRIRRALIGIAAATAIATVVFWNPLRQPAELTFLDVGHGDATFIRTPAGETILVDGGDKTGFIDVGQRVVAPFLWSNHVSRLDSVVGTHADRDHIGGLQYIVEHFDVGTLYLGPDRPEAKMEQELLALCKKRGVPVVRLRRGDTVPASGARIDVLHPSADWPVTSSDNDASVTLHMTWPGMNVLLTGDIEKRAESALESNAPKANVLKIPHHGSQTSSAESFIAAIDPAYAVVSSGRRLGGTVLREWVLDRYRVQGVAIYRTDWHGGIRLTTRNGVVQIESARKMRDYPQRSTP